MTLKRIFSGGQTGIDRGALDAALEAGFPAGGWCATGRKAEDGRIDARYPLVELPGGGYAARTRRNVIDADATVIIFFGELGGGSKRTHQLCVANGKPVLLLDADITTAEAAAAAIIGFVCQHRVQTLNVAGPRQSRAPAAHDYARRAIGNVVAVALQKLPGC